MALKSVTLRLKITRFLVHGMSPFIIYKQPFPVPEKIDLILSDVLMKLKTLCGIIENDIYNWYS